MNFSYTEEATALQIELSTKCNALCPGCIRTDFHTFRDVKKIIPANQELSPSVIDNILNSQWAKKLTQIEFCGTMDEPLAHSQFLEILDRIASSHSHIRVTIHTNGSLRGETYFKQLAERMKKFSSPSEIRFSIDGLEDTHSIYRYNTNFNKIIENLRAYISAGGRAIWQSLVFPWNQHQIETMKKLAQEIGCVGFYVRPDRTFVSSMGREKLEKIRAENRQPRSTISAGEEDNLTFAKQNINHPVDCVYKDQRKMIFISWDAKLWPCCFWTNIRYESQIKKDLQQKLVFDRYGENFNNLNLNSFDDVIQHSLFQKDLIQSWSSGDMLKWRCVERCSTQKVRQSDKKTDNKQHLEQIIFRN